MKVRDTIAIGVECFRKLIKCKSLFPLASHVLNHDSLSSLDLAVVQGKKFSTAFALGKNDLFASCSILELDPACDARL